MLKIMNASLQDVSISGLELIIKKHLHFKCLQVKTQEFIFYFVQFHHCAGIYNKKIIEVLAN